MTGQNVIDSARRLLADDHEGSAGHRWSDAALLVLVNQAQADLADRRPDLLLASNGTITAVADLTAASQSLAFSTLWRETLAQLVAAQALEEDGEDAANATRAQGFRQMFMDRIA